MVEQPRFSSIHDPIYVRLGFMAEGGGGGRRTSNHISDLENSADNKIFCSLSAPICTEVFERAAMCWKNWCAVRLRIIAWGTLRQMSNPKLGQLLLSLLQQHVKDGCSTVEVGLDGWMGWRIEPFKDLMVLTRRRRWPQSQILKSLLSLTNHFNGDVKLGLNPGGGLSHSDQDWL